MFETHDTKKIMTGAKRYSGPFFIGNDTPINEVGILESFWGGTTNRLRGQSARLGRNGVRSTFEQG